MKILIDMNLSPEWVGFFSANGIEAVHWSRVGSGSAEDSVLLAWARTAGYVVFTHDEAIERGAIVTVVRPASRVRVLPIERRK